MMMGWKCRPNNKRGPISWFVVTNRFSSIVGSNFSTFSCKHGGLCTGFSFFDVLKIHFVYVKFLIDLVQLYHGVFVAMCKV